MIYNEQTMREQVRGMIESGHILTLLEETLNCIDLQLDITSHELSIQNEKLDAANKGDDLELIAELIMENSALADKLVWLQDFRERLLPAAARRINHEA